MLTAKAMPDDQERCLAAGANDYMAKPLDVEKLLSLVRVWMPSTDGRLADKTEDIEIHCCSRPCSRSITTTSAATPWPRSSGG